MQPSPAQHRPDSGEKEPAEIEPAPPTRSSHEITPAAGNGNPARPSAPPDSPGKQDDARGGVAPSRATWLPPGWSTLSWKWVLGVGAAIVFGYAASINYFPDLDLGTSAALFAATALFGAFVLALLGFTFAAPAFLWLQIATPSRGLTRTVLGAPHAWRRAAWFGVPLSVLLVSTLAVFLYAPRGNAQGWWLLGLWISISVLTGLASLRDGRRTARARVPTFARGAKRTRPTGRSKARTWRLTGLAASLGFATAASALVLIVSLRVLLTLAPQARPGVSWTDPAVHTTLAVIVVVLVMNAFLVMAPRPALGGTSRSASPQRYTVDALRWRVFVGGMLVFFVLTAFGQWTWLAGRVMWRFGLGGVENASLVLDKMGCAIARSVGVLPPAGDGKEGEVCRVDGVTIDLRVGTTYVLRVPNAQCNTARRRFILSRDRVLSSISPPDPPVPDRASAQKPVSSQPTTAPASGPPASICPP